MGDLTRTASCLLFTALMGLCAICEAQSPIAPPGFPKGPFAAENLKSEKKGEILARVSPSTKGKLIKLFKKKHKGKSPSSRQLDTLLAKQLGLRVSNSINGDTLLVKGKQFNQRKLDRAKRSKLVISVEKNYSVFAFSDTNDLFYQLGFLWGLNSSGGFFADDDIDIDAPEAWEVSEGSPDLIVGVIDTGVYLAHRDLADNIWSNPSEELNGVDDDGNGYIDDVHGWDFINNDNDPSDDHFHGTHVAGTIAATRNNSYGIVGVAPRVKILPLKVLDSQGTGDTAGVIKAIDYAVKLRSRGERISILNASLGGGEPSEAVIASLKRAEKAGILFVAAAGNDGSDNDEEPVYPASYDLSNVISVAALTGKGALAEFSNFGRDTVHVAAPGDGIWSSIIFGFYLPFSGTSMAAPHVAGIAALVLSKNPSLSPLQVRDRIMNSIKPLDALKGRVKSPGIVSAALALR